MRRLSIFFLYLASRFFNLALDCPANGWPELPFLRASIFTYLHLLSVSDERFDQGITVLSGNRRRSVRLAGYCSRPWQLFRRCIFFCSPPQPEQRKVKVRLRWESIPGLLSSARDYLLDAGIDSINLIKPTYRQVFSIWKYPARVRAHSWNERRYYLDPLLRLTPPYPSIPFYVRLIRYRVPQGPFWIFVPWEIFFLPLPVCDG